MPTFRTTEASGPPSDPEIQTSRDGLDETTPLLRSSRSETSCSALSTFFDENAGLLLVAASQFFFTAMTTCVKWLNSLDEPVPMLELIWIRMAITYIGAVGYMLWQKIPDPLLGPKGVRGLLLLRGFSGFVGLAGIYLSLEHLSLSDSTMLTFLTPILTGFSGAIFLKEPFSLRQTFSGLCSFSGVILIARPQFLFGIPKGDPSEVELPEERMQSVTIGLLGVLGATGAYTLLRAIGKQAHTLHSLVFFSTSCVLGSTAGMVIFKIPPIIPTNVLWLAMMLLIGILGLCSQTLLVMGLQRETASRGVLGVYTSAVYAVAFQFIVFGTTPSALSIAGAAIILSSAIYISLTKQTAVKSVEQPPPTNPGQRDDPQP